MAAVDMPPFLSPLPSDEELEDDGDDQSPKTYLQKVLSERNNLRAQNSQLWKIIQKQRIIIQQLQKTLSGRDPKSFEEESDISVSQPSPPRKPKYRQEAYEEDSARSEQRALYPTHNELDSPLNRSVQKESSEKATKTRRRSLSLQKEDIYQIETKNDAPASSKEEKRLKRRSKTLPSVIRQPSASDKSFESKKSSKDGKKRRSKDLNSSLKTSMPPVQPETLVIEDSPAPENAIKSRVVEYKVKKVDHGSKRNTNDSKSSKKRHEREAKTSVDEGETAVQSESTEKKAPSSDTDQASSAGQECTEDAPSPLSSKKPDDPPKASNNSTVAPSSDNGSLESKDIPEATPREHKASKKSLGSQSRATLPGGAELASLDNIFIHVVGCTVKVNSKGKEVLIFRMQISRCEVSEDSSINGSPTQHLWTIEKLFPELVELDSQLRATGQNPKNSSVKLPEKKAWNTSSPSKIDQRKNYLQLAINCSPTCPSVMSEFISMGRVDEAEPSRPAGEKEGYLSKRGKNFGKWKRRYFSLNNSMLEYFESKNGAKLGEIYLAYAQVAVQQTSSLEYEPDASTDTFRHAFMILEPKRTTQSTLRHVLCADSDAERDEWVNAIGYHFTGDMQPPPPPMPEAEADSMLGSDHSSSPTPQDLSIAEKAESIGIASDANINNQSSTSLGSFSSANSEPRPTDPGQLPLRSRGISKPGETTVINIPNAMPKILKEGPPKPGRKTFWGKRLFSGDSGKNRAPQQPVFGVPLHQSVEASRVLEGYALSSVVYRCIQYLDSKQAQFEEGIYRLSGSSATIRMLRTKFDTEGDYGLVDSGVYYDVHAISGLLKLYLRELPSTVLTAELHRDFLQITELPTRRLRVRELGRLICSLPIENYTLLRALIGHLIVVVQEAGTNKMPLKNIVIVFAPTLGIPAGVFSLLLSEFKYVFYIDPEGTAIPQELSGEEETPPPSPTLQDSQVPELQEQDLRRAKHRHTVSADTVMELSKGVNLLLAASHDSAPEDDAASLDPVESRRSKRNSVIYRNRAPPDIVRLERQAEESISNGEELPDDLALESS